MRRFFQMCSLAFCLGIAPASAAISEAEIIKALLRPENSTGNIADAVDEATGARA